MLDTEIYYRLLREVENKGDRTIRVHEAAAVVSMSPAELATRLQAMAILDPRCHRLLKHIEINMTMLGCQCQAKDRASLIKAMEVKDGVLPAASSVGLYPYYYLTEAGTLLCPTCANGSLATDPQASSNPRWNVVSSVAYMEGGPVTCVHCKQCVESAYGSSSIED